MSDEPFDPEEPIAFEFTDELDLHAFHPRDAADLVRDYVAHASAHGWSEVRIIHGKGTGALARTVHAELAKLPSVLSFQLDSGLRGGWGATIVRLRRATS